MSDRRSEMTRHPDSEDAGNIDRPLVVPIKPVPSWARNVLKPIETKSSLIERNTIFPAIQGTQLRGKIVGGRTLVPEEGGVNRVDLEG